MIFTAGGFDDERREERVSFTYKSRRFDPENKPKIISWLLSTLAALILATSLFNILTIISFNLAEVLIDFSIFVFVSALILINYQPTRIARSLGFKKITYGFFLLIGLFMPPFIVQNILYALGYKSAFDFTYFAIVIAYVFCTNFFIATSWRWNRKFVDINMLGGIRIMVGGKGGPQLGRSDFPSGMEEDLIRNYLRGKITEEELLADLGDSARSKKILSYANLLIADLKKKYRW